MFEKKSMEELHRKTALEMQASKRHEVRLILDQVRSMHNVGAVFRTADAFAVHSISLCGYTPAPPHRDIQKTALGATETVPWKYFPDTESAIREAKAAGYRILAVEQVHQSISLSRLITPAAWRPTAFIFGNEVSGVSEEALALADGCIEIPQWGAKHSLNISVAVGVVLWETVRNGTISQAAGTTPPAVADDL